MITAQNRLAAANIATSNLKSGTDFSIAAIMARDELSRESSEYSKNMTFLIVFVWSRYFEKITNKNFQIVFHRFYFDRASSINRANSLMTKEWNFPIELNKWEATLNFYI